MAEAVRDSRKTDAVVDDDGDVSGTSDVSGVTSGTGCEAFNAARKTETGVLARRSDAFAHFR